MYRAYRFLFLLIFLLAACFGLSAHPHVYIDGELDFIVDDEGITALRQRWTLLRNFSPELIECYDLDRSGFFEPGEEALIYEEAFAPLVRFYYFTHIMIDGRDYFPVRIEDFHAEISGDRVVYSFTVPCGIKAGPDPVEIEISTHDDSSYVSFALLNVDDPYCGGIDYRIDFLRDGSVYSHADSMGHLRLLVMLKKKGAGSALPGVGTDAGGLQLIDASLLQPPPRDTYRNPFLLKNSPLPSATDNPFFS